MLHFTAMTQRVDGSATFTIVGDHVVGEVFDGEAIIIDTISGAYYSLPDGAAQVWSAVAGGASTHDAICNASAVDTDLALAVLSELVDAGLLVTAATMPPPTADAKPYLSKYSDMEELLLLDPIHDVAPAGWPAELVDPQSGLAAN